MTIHSWDVKEKDTGESIDLEPSNSFIQQLLWTEPGASSVSTASVLGSGKKEPYNLQGEVFKVKKKKKAKRILRKIATNTDNQDTNSFQTKYKSKNIIENIK